MGRPQRPSPNRGAHQDSGCDPSSCLGLPSAQETHWHDVECGEGRKPDGGHRSLPGTPEFWKVNAQETAWPSLCRRSPAAILELDSDAATVSRRPASLPARGSRTCGGASRRCLAGLMPKFRPQGQRNRASPRVPGPTDTAHLGDSAQSTGTDGSPLRLSHRPHEIHTRAHTHTLFAPKFVSKSSDWNTCPSPYLGRRRRSLPRQR